MNIQGIFMRICQHVTQSTGFGQKTHTLHFPEADEAFFARLAGLDHSARYKEVRPTLRALLAIILTEAGQLRKLFAYDQDLRSSLEESVRVLREKFSWDKSISDHMDDLVNAPQSILTAAQTSSRGFARLARVVYEDLAQSEKKGIFRDFVGTVVDRTGRVEHQNTPHRVEPISGWR